MRKVLKKYIALTTHRYFCGDELVKTWNMDERDKAFEYVKREGLDVIDYGNMSFPFYSLNEMTEYKEHGVTCTSKGNYEKNFALIEDTIKKYNLTEIDDYCNENKALWQVYRLAKDFDIPYMNVRCKGNITKHYINFPMFEKLIDAVNVKQQPYVIDGTDWPYWFNFGSKLLPSNTSNWFKYLQEEFDYVSHTSLVPYKGEDKYYEHKASNEN